MARGYVYDDETDSWSFLGAPELRGRRPAGCCVGGRRAPRLRRHRRGDGVRRPVRHLGRDLDLVALTPGSVDPVIELSKGQEMVLARMTAAARTAADGARLGQEPQCRPVQQRGARRRPGRLGGRSSAAASSSTSRSTTTATTRDGSVEHLGDNTTGSGDGDDETITVDLARVHRQIDTIFLLVTSYQGHTLEWVANAYCRVVDEQGVELARITLTLGVPETGVVMARISRDGEGWTAARGRRGDRGQAPDRVRAEAEALPLSDLPSTHATNVQQRRDASADAVPGSTDDVGSSAANQVAASPWSTQHAAGLHDTIRCCCPGSRRAPAPAGRRRRSSRSRPAGCSAGRAVPRAGSRPSSRWRSRSPRRPPRSATYAAGDQRARPITTAARASDRRRRRRPRARPASGTAAPAGRRSGRPGARAVRLRAWSGLWS